LQVCDAAMRATRLHKHLVYGCQTWTHVQPPRKRYTNQPLLAPSWSVPILSRRELRQRNCSLVRTYMWRVS